jgi:ribosomal protein S18 acetylase RimI-like enzyme
MIRPTLPADTPALVTLTEATGMFKPIEVQALQEVLDDYHTENMQEGHRCVTEEENGQIRGYAYYAPAAMTERTWYLYWIAVDPRLQGKGVGGQLLRYVEEAIRQEKGRHLLIETGSVPHYEPTRRFYLKAGYRQVAVIPDYYSVGDSMVVFRKVFSTE